MLFRRRNGRSENEIPHLGISRRRVSSKLNFNLLTIIFSVFVAKPNSMDHEIFFRDNSDEYSFERLQAFISEHASVETVPKKVYRIEIISIISNFFFLSQVASLASFQSGMCRKGVLDRTRFRLFTK
jgi:hypothetical protein